MTTLNAKPGSETPPSPVGLGGTPDEALAALEAVVDACEHPADSQVPAAAGSICGFCDEVSGESNIALAQELHQRLMDAGREDTAR